MERSHTIAPVNTRAVLTVLGNPKNYEPPGPGVGYGKSKNCSIPPCET
ncbi:hypothetical protein [Richelia intracellularis]|nr:hypothetical protein [Richelia intracellularis]